MDSSSSNQQHAAVTLLSQDMKKNSNNDDDGDVKLIALVDVDPDFMKVTRNKKVEHFLEDLQTIHITESIKITPQFMFYVLVIVFLLPSIWAVISTLIATFPSRLFFDGCEKRGSSNITIPFGDCIKCCNGRTYLILDLVPISTTATIGRIVTISFAGVVAILSGPAYAKLSLGEHLAIHCLSYGVVVKTQASFSQLLSVIIFSFLFAGIAGLYLWVQSELTRSLLDNSILGFGDVCDPTSRFAGEVLHAVFSRENPTLRSSSTPQSVFDYFRSFAVIFLPFVPVILKMFNAANTTFSKLGLDHMIMDSKKSAETFQVLKWEVLEVDLLDSIERYANLCQSEETIGRIMRRIIACDMKFKRPIPAYFSFAWGQRDLDMQRVLTFLHQDNKLEPYRPILEAKKKMSVGGKQQPPQGVPPAATNTVAPPTVVTDTSQLDALLDPAPAVTPASAPSSSPPPPVVPQEQQQPIVEDDDFL